MFREDTGVKLIEGVQAVCEQGCSPTREVQKKINPDLAVLSVGLVRGPSMQASIYCISMYIYLQVGPVMFLGLKARIMTLRYAVLPNSNIAYTKDKLE